MGVGFGLKSHCHSSVSHPLKHKKRPTTPRFYYIFYMVFAGKKLRSAAERLQKAAYELMAAGGGPAKVTRRLGGRLVSCFGRCKPWVSGFQTGCQIIRPDLFYFTKEALILEMIGSFILSCWGLVMPCGNQWQYTWPRWRWLHDPPDTLSRVFCPTENTKTSPAVHPSKSPLEQS